jgi:hypothetical protein
MGLRGENHWIFRGYDHDATYARRAQWISEGEPDEVYMSFPSLKDLEAKGHTTELIAFAGGLTTLSHLPDGVSFPQAFTAAAKAG